MAPFPLEVTPEKVKLRMVSHEDASLKAPIQKLEKIPESKSVNKLEQQKLNIKKDLSLDKKPPS